MSKELNTLAPKKWVANFAGAAPTLDTSDGIIRGDVAFDSSTTPNKIWRCLDATESAPLWHEIDFMNNTGVGTINPLDRLHVKGVATGDTDPDSITPNNLYLESPADGETGVFIGDAVNGPVWYMENYRGEQSEFFYLYNQKTEQESITINTGGRIGFNEPGNIMDYHAWYVNPATGALNDIDIGGIYTSRLVAIYEIAISTTGATDTFKWRRSDNDGISWGAYSANIAITGAAQTIERGIEVTIGNTTGHNTNDIWRFPAHPQLPSGSHGIRSSMIDEINITSDYTAGTPTWTDVTCEMAWTASGNIDAPSTGTTSAVYIGCRSDYNSVYPNIAAAGTGVTLKVEYYTATGWVELTAGAHSFSDGTANLTQTGSVSWDKSTMTDWVKHIPPGHGGSDNYNLFWVRLTSTTNVTAAPSLFTISRHGIQRLGVYTSHKDTIPAFMVDALGRIVLGTNTATGNNKLQIVYPYGTRPSLTSPSTLAEFDSEDSSRSEYIYRLSQSTATGLCSITTAKSRGTLAAPTNMATNDHVGQFGFKGYINNSWQALAGWRCIYTGNGTTNYSTMVFGINNNSTDPETVFALSRNASTGNGIIQMMNNLTAVGAGIEEFSIDGLMAGNSDLAVPTEKAVVTYTAAQLGSPKWAVTAAQTNTYAIQTTDCVVVCDTTSNAFSATLPTAVGVVGKIYVIKRISAGTNRLTLATTSGQTIDGVTTAILDGQYNSIMVCSNGANWYII